MAAAGAVFVGSKAKKAEVVSATDDRMISVVIDLADAVGYTDFHKPEVHYYDASYSTIDGFADLHQLTGTYYTANITYDSANQNIDCIQFLFKQTNDEDKWSNSISINSRANYVYHFAFQNIWTGSNWDVAKDSWEGAARIQGNDLSETYFVADISKKTFKASNLELNPGKNYQIFYGKWNFGAIRQDSIDRYLDECTLNYFTVSEAGTYDIIGYNDYADGGIFEIKKHEAASTVNIYYVLENDTPTNDYIYTWGGNEQFGSWPGTKITEVDGVAEVTNNCTFKFQGNSRLIYKIPVKTGYPVGDSQFKFNNGSSVESAARPISGHHAYWWSGDANGLAGYSIEFLIEAEAIRNGATDFSVCNVSKSDATSLVSTYQSLGSHMQETYVDCTTVNTWSDKTKTSKSYFTYRKVMEELAKIAEIDIGGSSSPSLQFRNAESNSQSIIIIVSIGVASISALSLLIVLKKRKQN